MLGKLILLSLLIYCAESFADVAMYGGKTSIFTKQKGDLLLHYHAIHYDENDSPKLTSYIELLDLSNAGKTTFKINSPMFTHLFIANDADYFIGISNIRSHSNPQLVLYSRLGEKLKVWSFSCKDLADNEFCAESLYNYIQWFDESDPQVSITTIESRVIITVDNNSFHFGY